MINFLTAILKLYESSPLSSFLLKIFKNFLLKIFKKDILRTYVLMIKNKMESCHSAAGKESPVFVEFLSRGI
jgi:hypothetical protein